MKRAPKCRCISAKPDEIVFTGGGSRAITWFCAAMCRQQEEGQAHHHHAVEQHAELNPSAMEREGVAELTILPVMNRNRYARTVEGRNWDDTVSFPLCCQHEVGTNCRLRKSQNLPRKGVLFIRTRCRRLGMCRSTFPK
jgi:hypothetical protein